MTALTSIMTLEDLMQSVVTAQNWTSCRYESGVYRAFISFGADPETLAQGRYLYFVTVTEGEDKEVFQETFGSLNLACVHLNEKYAGSWNFVDQAAPKSGCDSCVAH